MRSQLRATLLLLICRFDEIQSAILPYNETHSRIMVELTQAAYCVESPEDSFVVCPSCTNEMKVTTVVNEDGLLSGARALVSLHVGCAQPILFVLLLWRLSNLSC